jgi:hypothetical protein
VLPNLGGGEIQTVLPDLLFKKKLLGCRLFYTYTR